MFYPTQVVRRNPKIWPNDKARFKVLALKGDLVIVQRAGTTKCPWTGKQVPHDPMPYQVKELAAI